MVKIFIGNLPQEADTDELQALFSQYGAVTECAIIKNFAFVHMEDRKSATKAIRNLHLYKLHGTPINVEASHGKNQGPVKLHVANVEKGCDDELRALFEEYGTVTECAVIKNFAFIHMANSEEAMDAIKGLDNSDFQGKRIHVQISKSRPRGEEEEEYGQPPPDRAGYWPPRFPGDGPEPGPPGYFRGRFSHPVSHGPGTPCPSSPAPHLPRGEPPTPTGPPPTTGNGSAIATGSWTITRNTAPVRTASPRTRSGASAPSRLPRPRLRHHEGAPSAPRPSTPTSVGPSRPGLFVLPRDRSPIRRAPPAPSPRRERVLVTSAPASRRCPCPGPRCTGCHAPGTPTPTGCRRRRRHPRTLLVLTAPRRVLSRFKLSDKIVVS
ncbi:hypothetical protein ANANG_G00070920 [Anguilla anguilla]|uniref:RRM domain-containing protein n=1 Tax=Anguilla anguilla TaxID=7936 RepID=A0A9D3MQF9_ANGAN|nr:hypothetical protein ANANG_G00070920 [Anguilla anguilla]